MKKAWHNPRQVIVREAPTEPENARRLEALVCLLATGMERLLAAQGKESPKSLDFTPGVLPNVCTGNETTKMENV